jgi:outer membrane usher protein
VKRTWLNTTTIALVVISYPVTAVAFPAEDLPMVTAPPVLVESYDPAISGGMWIAQDSGPIVTVPPAADPAAATPGPADADDAPAPAPQQARPDINPYARDIELTVPLTFNRRPLGEVPVLLTQDDRFIVDSRGFLSLIQPLLTEEAHGRIVQALAGRDGFASDDLVPVGITLEYDPTALSILVVRIDPALRQVEELFRRGGPETPAMAPEHFSAFLNTAFTVNYQHDSGEMTKPNAYLNGAVRWGSVVLEADVQGRQQLGSDEYNILRRYVRLVYDQPEQFRRWSLGDLEPEYRGLQGFTDLGGVGVARQRRRFDPYRPGILRADRQLLLQNDSTVRILRNGALVREIRLDAGQYNLSNLPLQVGSNDLEIQVVDATGLTQSLTYNSYLDPIDLDPGEYEYAVYAGVTGRPNFGEPDYEGGDFAVSGYWRKAFMDRPALGVGWQASRRVQMVDAQTQFVLRNGSRLSLQAAVSNSDAVGSGYAGILAFDHYIDRSTTSDFLNAQVTFTSEHFSTLGQADALNPIAWQASAQYSRSFSDRLYGSLGASYNRTRDASLIGNSYRGDATVYYSLNRQWSVQAGANYTHFDDASTSGRSRDGFGFTIGLTWRPSPDQRADARYDHGQNAGSLSYIRTPDNVVGAIGYSGLLAYDDGPSSFAGSVNYIGNRYEASVTHAAFGQDFEGIGEQQVTSASFSTSFAYAGGRAAIGRRVGDSFAILYGHPSLEERRVIAGEILQNGQYNASSGPLGPVLYPALGSYVNDSVFYDVIDLPAGYDLGEGVIRVHPAYHSGYALEIGNAAFVSAVGTLQGDGPAGPAPIALIGGRVTEAAAPDAESQPFFTNTAGRFAIQGLEPGKRYVVELYTEPRSTFDFEVPADNDGLLNMRFVHVRVPVREE